MARGAPLVALAAALLVAAAAAAGGGGGGGSGGGAYWTSLSYPVGDEKQHTRASSMVKIEAIGEAGHIAYHTIYRSDQVPLQYAGPNTPSAQSHTCRSCLGEAQPSRLEPLRFMF